MALVRCSWLPCRLGGGSRCFRRARGNLISAGCASPARSPTWCARRRRGRRCGRSAHPARRWTPAATMAMRSKGPLTEWRTRTSGMRRSAASMAAVCRGRERDEHVRANQGGLRLVRHDHGVADDGAAPLQPLQPALHGRARDPETSREVGGGSARVLAQQREQRAVGVVERDDCHCDDIGPSERRECTVVPSVLVAANGRGTAENQPHSRRNDDEERTRGRRRKDRAGGRRPAVPGLAHHRRRRLPRDGGGQIAAGTGGYRPQRAIGCGRSCSTWATARRCGRRCTASSRC